MTSSLKIDIRGEAAQAWLGGAADRLHRNVRTAVDRLSIELQTLVKNKLSGPVLHNRTGTLRRSINRRIVDTPVRISAQVGTNVVYAAIHEYGFNGVVDVREHTRRTFAVSDKGKRGLPKGEGVVKAHKRHMSMPERSYLRSSLDEMSPRITEGIRAAALEALR